MLLPMQYFVGNPDSHDPKFNSKKAGIYEEGCGLRNVTMSWGHDEYMYQV
jgi:inositol oxygenase